MPIHLSSKVPAVCAALAIAGLLVACAPSQTGNVKQDGGEATQDAEPRATQETLSFEETLIEKGLTVATVEQISEMRLGNTIHFEGDGWQYAQYHPADGGPAQVRVWWDGGENRGTLTYDIREGGIVCGSVEEGKGFDESLTQERCFRFYYEDDTEHWIHVSGPATLKTGSSKLLEGDPFGLAAAAEPATVMNAAEISELLVGNTIFGVYDAWNLTWAEYFAPDGTTKLLLRFEGQDDMEATGKHYPNNKDQYCTEDPEQNVYCNNLISLGGGKYQQVYSNGERGSIYNQILEGDQVEVFR